MTAPRKGQAPAMLGRDEFHLKFSRSFIDPAFSSVADALTQIEEVAWNNYSTGNKAPITAKAGNEFFNPDYKLSVEWKATRDKLLAAEATQKNPATPSRVLLICGSARNDGTCPG